jgi:hypothetical protein
VGFTCVRESGRSWFFVGTFEGKRIELGLGSALDVTLAKARERAAAIRTTLVDGIDPRVERAKSRAPNLWPHGRGIAPAKAP